MAQASPPFLTRFFNGLERMARGYWEAKDSHDDLDAEIQVKFNRGYPGYGVRSMIVWNKESPGMGMGWRSQHELIMCGTRENAMWLKHQGAQGNVITLKRDPNLEHPTMKPVALLDTVLETTPFVKTVYDPFVGSGTTIIAAERQGRACWAMELEPRYVDSSVKRWEDYTGGKARRE